MGQAPSPGSLRRVASRHDLEGGRARRPETSAGEEAVRKTLAIALAVLSACADAPGAGPRPTQDGPAADLRLVRVAGGLKRPVYLTAPPGDERLFIVEQPGRVRIVRKGTLLRRPFLDLTDRVRARGERGLLGMAFHPDYASNGRLFVDYTDSLGTTRIEEFAVTADPDSADRASGRLLLSVDQPYPNHNGGQVFFGPDGMLYIGMGDGGSAGDPRDNGQNRRTLLGAILRIDVDAPPPFGIPPDNPFVDDPGGRDEIWAWGLRNPWRSSFDRVTGDLYLADVGQNSWEEIDVLPAGRAGANLGWNVMEGGHCFRASNCDNGSFVPPVLEYNHSQGCSVIGGYVYRGIRLPELTGRYVYSDYCSGWLRSFRLTGGTATERRQLPIEAPGRVQSFGEDASGELYVLVRGGGVFRIDRAH